ncbi:MAG: hypothetical protein R3F11_27405 [Verrucomicrobiales bacterium]
MKKAVLTLVVVGAGAAGVWYYLNHQKSTSAPAPAPVPAITDADAQKKTVEDIRNMGTAWMSWLTDQVGENEPPDIPPLKRELERDLMASALPLLLLAQAAAPDPAPPVQCPVGDYAKSLPAVTFTITKANRNGPGQGVEFRKVPYESTMVSLHPADDFFYMKEIPKTDGWGHEIEVYIHENLLGANVFVIRSPGRDGKFSSTEYSISSFEAGNFDDDIVWADGYMVRWPEQKKE